MPEDGSEGSAGSPRNIDLGEAFDLLPEEGHIRRDTMTEEAQAAFLCSVLLRVEGGNR